MTSSDRRTAVILLHGIGDQARRATIGEFLGTLVGLELGQTDKQKILREPDTADDEFAYFVAEGKIGRQPVTLAEYYWADLSRVRSGFFSILRNFFQLVVDAPDIIYACLGPRLVDGKTRDFFALRCLRSLLALMMWLIYFPIIAINVVYAILVAEFALHVARRPDVALDVGADGPFAITSAIALVVFGFILFNGRLNNHLRAVSAMVMVVLAAVIGFSVYNLFVAKSVFTYGEYATFFNAGLNSLWFVVILGNLLFLILMPLLCLFFRRRWRGILLGFTTTFLVVRFWLALITTLWLVYLTSIFEDDTYDKLIAHIGGPIRFVSLLWFDVVVVGLVLFSSLVVYVLRTLRNRPNISGETYPRLIIPSALPAVAIILAVGGVAIIGACNCALVLEQCTPMKCEFMFAPSEWIFANAATLLAVGGIIIQFAHSRFEVAIDIVNFFKSDRGHRRINPFGAIASVFQYKPDDIFEFRLRLQRRLDKLIDDLNAAFGPFERMVFVGHSLGTMIAIDRLRSVAQGEAQPGRWELITLGSPYAAIFHHYFPHMFAAAGKELIPGLSRWTNIYRENDYVGTNLTDGKAGVSEVVQPPFGHLHYFSDEAVVTEIVHRIDDTASGSRGTP